jgi:tRNA A-37 threonylcarbamoyl transferase component Bud32
MDNGSIEWNYTRKQGKYNRKSKHGCYASLHIYEPQICHFGTSSNTFLESTMLVDNTLGSLSQQIEDKIKNLQITSSASTVPTYVLASPRNHTNTHANALDER